MKPVSKTAFYCCGVRMLDAERANPICGDSYAKLFMNEQGREILEKFKDETRPNSANVARHRLIDDFLREQLTRHSQLRVVIIGAGFDTRAFRLNGGAWLELDEIALIKYKNERLPVTDCKNELERIPIDFATESLSDKLAPFSTDLSAVVVIEGVFMYLQEDVILELLQTLRRLFGNHTLICDLMTRDFFENQAVTMQEKVSSLGASFKFIINNPQEMFLSNGYKLMDKMEVIEKSFLFESPELPTEILNTILPTLPSGYSIHVFEAT